MARNLKSFSNESRETESRKFIFGDEFSFFSFVRLRLRLATEERLVSARESLLRRDWCSAGESPLKPYTPGSTPPPMPLLRAANGPNQPRGKTFSCSFVFLVSNFANSAPTLTCFDLPTYTIAAGCKQITSGPNDKYHHLVPR